MVLMTEAKYNSRRMICLTNARCLLLVVGGAVPGASGADVMIATSTDTCFAISSIAPPPLDLTLFYAGLCPLLYILLYSTAIWSEDSALYSSLEYYTSSTAPPLPLLRLFCITPLWLDDSTHEIFRSGV